MNHVPIYPKNNTITGINVDAISFSESDRSSLAWLNGIKYVTIKDKPNAVTSDIGGVEKNGTTYHPHSLLRIYALATHPINIKIGHIIIKLRLPINTNLA